MAIKPKGLVVVAMYVSPGVSRGAGGFVIVNGKLKKVPPRGPVFKQSRGGDPGGCKQARRALARGRPRERAGAVLAPHWAGGGS